MLVLVGPVHALVAHGQNGHQLGLRVLRQDRLRRCAGHRERGYVNRIAARRSRRRRSHRTGAGGLHDALAGKIHRRRFKRRVPVVEPLGPAALHLTHQDVSNGRVGTPYLQRLLHFSHQGDPFRAPVEGDGRRGKRAEHVDDQRRAGGLVGVSGQTADANFHISISSFCMDVQDIQD